MIVIQSCLCISYGDGNDYGNGNHRAPYDPHMITIWLSCLRVSCGDGKDYGNGTRDAPNDLYVEQP